VRERLDDLGLGVQAREHDARRARVERAPGADPLGGLGAHDHRHVVRGRGEQLADERVLAAGAVLEVDQQPVEAGQRARLGRER
jgi:hypothetical protein